MDFEPETPAPGRSGFQHALSQSVSGTRSAGHDDLNQAGVLNEPAHGVLSPSGDCDSAVSLPGLEEGHDFEASSKAIERSNRHPESV